MKKLIVFTLSFCLFSILYSFKYSDKDRVELLSDGNYYVSNSDILSEEDGRSLLDMTTTGNGTTTVVHTTVINHTDRVMAGETKFIHQTVWKHKDHKKDKSFELTQKEVSDIMNKYL